MSKLEQLIKKHCPDGVEYVSIGNLICRIREKGKDVPEVNQVYVVSNTQGIVKAEEYRENTIHSEDTSNYTVVRQNMIAYNPSRLNIGSIARLKESKAGLVSPMYVVFSVDSNKILYDYFDYLITSSYVSGKINSFKEDGARFRFDFSRWNWIIIPLPPLEVQSEIVRILNKFTELTTELTAELEARKKQYVYYRNKILSSSNGSKLLLKDIATTFRGEYITKSSTQKGNIPVILGGQEPAYYIDKYNHQGELVVVSRSGASAGFVSYWNEKVFVTDGFGYEAKENIVTPKYLYHILKNIEPKLNSMKRGAGVPHVRGEALSNLEFLIPPIEEQNRVVSILDHFDTICYDISEGLPAEIEGRRKQYEYYRDKLLTFKEKVN